MNLFADLKENLCDEKEIISNHKTKQESDLAEAAEMADGETADTKECVDEIDDARSNSNKSPEPRKSAAVSRHEDEELEQNGDDNSNHSDGPEPGELNFNALVPGMDPASSAAAAAAVMNEANSLFNTAMFQPGQMSMQTFQNAIAQFTANAIASNMDNETVMKNLAILQSALFTLQQQQFLQFQLIQHLQSQLVHKKGSDGGTDRPEQSDSEDEEKPSKSGKEPGEIDEDELEDDEIIESTNNIHQRLLEKNHFSKMDAIIKESENR